MPLPSLPVFFHEGVLAMKAPDGLFERASSPLLEHQMMLAESPERIANIRSVLQRAPSANRFEWHPGRLAEDEEILRFHKPAYLDDLKRWNESGFWATPTTYLPPGGMDSVRAATGTVLAALEGVLEHDLKRAYALVRPPSHHAAPDVADGYCFLNAVGMAVQTARERGCQRVAVVDWDVHHGNGTQTGFYGCDDVLCISMHMDHGAWGPTHPETGNVHEVGSGQGAGYNINLPLPPGMGDAAYVEVIDTIVVPALHRFDPDLIVVSNGHDANQFDPNGRQSVTMAGFREIADSIGKAADSLCDGRLLAVQEGGYNIAYVGFCAYASALGLIGQSLDIDDPLAFYLDDGARASDTVAQLVDSHPLLRIDRSWNPRDVR